MKCPVCHNTPLVRSRPNITIGYVQLTRSLNLTNPMHHQDQSTKPSCVTLGLFMAARRSSHPTSYLRLHITYLRMCSMRS